MVNYEQLKLENQLCFPFYAISRLIIRQYQPFLDKFGITYPQYLVLLVLWEKNNQTVNEIAQKLILNTNTITPLLKRMEMLGFLTRTKSKEDERKVIVSLTGKAWSVREEAVFIPDKIAGTEDADERELESMEKFKKQLYALLNAMKESDTSEE
jgi:DNA-binding MarR family transcriptional regulator